MPLLFSNITVILKIVIQVSNSLCKNKLQSLVFEKVDYCFKYNNGS